MKKDGKTKNYKNKKISEQVFKKIEVLKNSEKTHFEIIKKMLKVDGGKIFAQDLIIIAVVKRSLSLINGFSLMVENKNVLCAVPLLRLQIDSLIRLYACWLVDNPKLVFINLSKGIPLSKLKSKTGKSLTDKYLRSEISKLCPWVDNVYKKTSGFIHLSTPEMIASLTDINTSSHTFSLHIGKIENPASGREWTEDEIIETIDAFIAATRCILYLIASWIETKKEATN